MLYEQICRADHGRTVSYEMHDGKPVAVLDETLGDKEVFDKLFRSLQDDITYIFSKIAALDFDKYSQMENVVMRTTMTWLCI